MTKEIATEKLVGHIPVDSAQVIVLDPANLPDDGEAAYERIVKLTTQKGAGPVKLSPDERGKPGTVAVETNVDGMFPVYVSYDENGQPLEIIVRLQDDPA
jgi:hypothetical protein